MSEVVLGASAFFSGMGIALALFVFNVVRKSGLQAFPVLTRIAGRTFVITSAMLGAFFGFAVLVFSLIVAPLLFFGERSFFSDYGIVIGILGLSALTVFIPVYAFNFARDAARFTLHVASDISVYSSALILGIFMAGLWLSVGTVDTDGSILVVSVIVSALVLMSLISQKTSQSGRVSGLERWTLIASLFLSIYILLASDFPDVFGILIAGYAAGAACIRFIVLFLPQHHSFAPAGLGNRRPWKEIRMRVLVFTLAAGAIVINYFGDLVSMPILVGLCIAAADAIGTFRSREFATVAFDWHRLKKTDVPSVWSLVRITMSPKRRS